VVAEAITAETAPRAPSIGISPRARRLAADAGIDPAHVIGSGPDGLVSERDVVAAIGARGAPAAGERPGCADQVGRAERTRRAVADVTSDSWRTIPHFYLNLQADVTRALQHARPTALVFVAVARALSRHPECNLAWQDDSLVQRQTVDLGLLVATPDGLLRTTIGNADGFDLAGMEDAVGAAITRARSGVLVGHDLAPRSMTISNLGMFSVDSFSAVITPPDPLMLAVGRVRTEPRWDGGAWSTTRVVSLTLSVDHRALDGATAARLLTTLETILSEAEGALR
jgi:pyruvate dehydrogenase E2 component (dihydrolipoamide acetyltransferase)